MGSLAKARLIAGFVFCYPSLRAVSACLGTWYGRFAARTCSRVRPPSEFAPEPRRPWGRVLRPTSLTPAQALREFCGNQCCVVMHCAAEDATVALDFISNNSYIKMQVRATNQGVVGSNPARRAILLLQLKRLGLSDLSTLQDSPDPAVSQARMPALDQKLSRLLLAASLPSAPPPNSAAAFLNLNFGPRPIADLACSGMRTLKHSQ
jgi:hypothetical protein